MHAGALLARWHGPSPLTSLLLAAALPTTLGWTQDLWQPAAGRNAQRQHRRPAGAGARAGACFLRLAAQTAACLWLALHRRLLALNNAGPGAHALGANRKLHTSASISHACMHACCHAPALLPLPLRRRAGPAVSVGPGAVDPQLCRQGAAVQDGGGQRAVLWHGVIVLHAEQLTSRGSHILEHPLTCGVHLAKRKHSQRESRRGARQPSTPWRAPPTAAAPPRRACRSTGVVRGAVGAWRDCAS